MLAVIGIVCGALVAMVQPDMKKLVAYSSVSHLGFVVLGICAMNVQGMQGAVYQMLAHGISTGGLFLMVGMLSDRRHTRLISEFGGEEQHAAPHRGVPDHHARINRHACSQRIYRRVPDHAWRVPLGSALCRRRRSRCDPVGDMLWMFQRVYLGPITNQKERHPADLQPREWASVLPLCAAGDRDGRVPVAVPDANGAVREESRGARPERSAGEGGDEMQNAKGKRQIVKCVHTVSAVKSLFAFCISFELLRS